MFKKIILMAVCLGFSRAASADVNFDQGVDVKGFIGAATSADIKIPETKAGIVMNMTMDCKNIVFGANDPLISPEITLNTQETTQNCYSNQGEPFCYPPGIQYYREVAKIVITEPRVLKPEQKEVFQVCLLGAFLNLKPVSTVYKYDVKRVLGGFQLTPQALLAKSGEKDVLLEMSENARRGVELTFGTVNSEARDYCGDSFSRLDATEAYINALEAGAGEKAVLLEMNNNARRSLELTCGVK